MLNFLSNQKTQLLLCILLALGLRLNGISSRPIWYDEAFSILISDQGPSGILAGTISMDTNATAAEEHPPAYYFMLSGWIKVFGDSLPAVRMLSILGGLGVTILAYLIAQHLFDSSTALVAGILTATLPFQIHYSQEIRMYIFLALWLSLATYSLLKKKWLIFAISAALAQYTHNLAAIYLIVLAFTPVIYKDWKMLRSVFLAGTGALVLYTPWLIHLPQQFAKIHSNFWIEKPGLERFFTLILYYIPNLPLPNTWLAIGLLLSTFIITIAGFQTYIAVKNKVPTKNSGLWLAYLSFAPPIVLWLISQIQPVYVERALLSSHVVFCIWLAWVLTQTKLPVPIKALISLSIVTAASLGIYHHNTYRGFPYGPYDSINNKIKDELKAGDVIIHSNKLSYLPAYYFNREIPQGFIIDELGSSTDTLSPTTSKILHLSSLENIQTVSKNATRIWFIIYQQSIDEFTAQGYKTHPQLEYLNAAYKLERTETWDDLRIYLYKKVSP